MAERQQLHLADGRCLDYLEVGDPAGAPAVYLHGTPSSASEARWLHRAASEQGVRLVSLDRPGYLGSEPRLDASLVGGAEAVVSLARALRLGRFAVVGFSGGAPYALAAAHLAPAEVTVAHLGGGICSLADAADYGLAWWRRLVFGLTAWAPVVSVPLLGFMLGRVGRKLQGRLGAPDEAALELFEGAARGAQIAAVIEYVQSSDAEELRSEISDYIAATGATKAVVADMVAVARPWPFELDSVATPVEIWHGRDDPAVPVGFAEAMAASLPNGRAHLFEGEGHFVFHTHADAVAASIREHAAITR
jgi:pimeloyl-ACP methyl ester carboxylesterase